MSESSESVELESDPDLNATEQFGQKEVYNE